MKKLSMLLLSFFAVTTLVNAQAEYWSYNSPGGQGLDQAFSVTRTRDGKYVFAGRTGTVGINAGDFYISKIGSVGGLLWAKTYVGSSIDEARAIMELKDGNLIVAGVTVDFGGNTS